MTRAPACTANATALSRWTCQSFASGNSLFSLSTRTPRRYPAGCSGSFRASLPSNEPYRARLATILPWPQSSAPSGSSGMALTASTTAGARSGCPARMPESMTATVADPVRGSCTGGRLSIAHIRTSVWSSTARGSRLIRLTRSVAATSKTRSAGMSARISEKPTVGRQLESSTVPPARCNACAVSRCRRWESETSSVRQHSISTRSTSSGSAAAMRWSRSASTTSLDSSGRILMMGSSRFQYRGLPAGVNSLAYCSRWWVNVVTLGSLENATSARSSANPSTRRSAPSMTSAISTALRVTSITITSSGVIPRTASRSWCRSRMPVSCPARSRACDRGSGAPASRPPLPPGLFCLGSGSSARVRRKCACSIPASNGICVISFGIT